MCKIKAIKNICIQENFIIGLIFLSWVTINPLPNNPALFTTNYLT